MHQEFEENKKNSYKYIINNLIAADDLFWNKDENKYNALSKKELDQILMACITQGIKNEDDCLNIVNWCTQVKVGSLLLKNFIEGKILISSLDAKGEPYFVPNKSI